MKGYVALRARALKGSTMFVVASPVMLFARLKVTDRFCVASAVYCVSFMRYNCAVLSKTSPKGFSKRRHALDESQMFGSMDSTNA